MGDGVHSCMKGFIAGAEVLLSTPMTACLFSSVASLFRLWAFLYSILSLLVGVSFMWWDGFLTVFDVSVGWSVVFWDGGLNLVAFLSFGSACSGVLHF